MFDDDNMARGRRGTKSRRRASTRRCRTATGKFKKCGGGRTTRRRHRLDPVDNMVRRRRARRSTVRCRTMKGKFTKCTSRTRRSGRLDANAGMARGRRGTTTRRRRATNASQCRTMKGKFTKCRSAGASRRRTGARRRNRLDSF